MCSSFFRFRQAYGVVLQAKVIGYGLIMPCWRLFINTAIPRNGHGAKILTRPRRFWSF